MILQGLLIILPITCCVYLEGERLSYQSAICRIFFNVPIYSLKNTYIKYDSIYRQTFYLLDYIVECFLSSISDSVFVSYYIYKYVF